MRPAFIPTAKAAFIDSAKGPYGMMHHAVMTNWDNRTDGLPMARQRDQSADHAMNTGAQEFDTSRDACLFQAAALMQHALGLLDQAGQSLAATHLQHALETLDLCLPVSAQRH